MIGIDLDLATAYMFVVVNARILFLETTTLPNELSR